VAGDVADLRSDTLTRPTPAMRRAMADADVGDDAYGEDPTVNALEEAYAQRVGKQAALFVPSGTMANQLAVRVLGPAGTTVVAGRTSHVAAFEAAAAGSNTPAQLFTVDDGRGTVDADEVAWLVEAAQHHWARPSLVCVENTHMLAGGVPWPLEALRSLAAVGLPVHADGARLFNAVVATGTSASAYAQPCTTVWSALTKGLCAPVGSVLAGPTAVIDEARAQRQRMGGQMRQAGVVAAAGLVALEHMVERLADDHHRARVLAEAVAERWPDAGLDPSSVRTNIVIFRHPFPEAVIDHLAAHGVLAGTVAPRTMRLVTHHDVDDGHVERARRALATAP
jgi:threonine aldolase